VALNAGAGHSKRAVELDERIRSRERTVKELEE
jgi:hypothetical protein